MSKGSLYRLVVCGSLILGGLWLGSHGLLPSAIAEGPGGGDPTVSCPGSGTGGTATSPCTPTPPPPPKQCDNDGDGVKEADCTCDNDGDGKKESCYECDADGDGTKDTCMPCGQAPAGISNVKYIENIVAPFNNSWGAMKETTWTVDCDVYLDCSAKKWKCKVSQADSAYKMFYRLLPGVTEASVAAATTQPILCKMKKDLAALGNIAGCQWYMVGAVEAHERVHVVEWKSCMGPEFTAMKTTIEGLSIDYQCGATGAQAKTAIKALPAYTKAVNDAFSKAVTAFYAIPDPNAQTDAAEHGVVDPMIAALEAKRVANGWPACP